MTRRHCSTMARAPSIRTDVAGSGTAVVLNDMLSNVTGLPDDESPLMPSARKTMGRSEIKPTNEGDNNCVAMPPLGPRETETKALGADTSNPTAWNGPSIGDSSAYAPPP